MCGVRRKRRPAGHSLTNGEEFQAVYRAGRRFVFPVGVIFVLPRDDARLRLGIPTGRRLGSAVVRNRLRRRFREAFRTGTAGLSGGADVVIVPRSRASVAEFSEIVDSVRSALGFAGINDSPGTPR